jgi:hypothetical protein
MSQPTSADERAITVEDLKHQAYAVRDQAVSDAHDVYERAIGESTARTVIFGIAALVVVASVAFYLGTRSGRGNDFAEL